MELQIVRLVRKWAEMETKTVKCCYNFGVFDKTERFEL